MTSYDLLHGDVMEMLGALADNSVHCVITSPPYWMLRRYGHDSREMGQERTPLEYVARIVEVFREVRRVLRPDGTCWVNIADSYANDAKGPRGMDKSTLGGPTQYHRGAIPPRTRKGYRDDGIKRKDRVGVPERLVLALQDDGWWWRDEIIWHKPGPMPASVTDRTTPAHEKVYMLTKRPRYFYDQDAIREPLKESSLARLGQDVEAQAGSARANGGAKTNGTMKAVSRYSFARSTKSADVPGANNRQHREDRDDVAYDGIRPQLRRAYEVAREAGLTEAHIAAIRACGITDAGYGPATMTGAGRNDDEVKRLAAEAKRVLGGYYREFLSMGGANKRSVWSVQPAKFTDAHFATMPPKLIEPMILAGTSARGVCPHCGAPWTRSDEIGPGGWQPGCDCEDNEPVPATVLDPFNGAGTVGLVALRNGRRYIGIELYDTFVEMTHRRLHGVQLGIGM